MNQQEIVLLETCKVSEVFLSYSRSDRIIVEKLVHALHSRNISVSWDQQVAAGSAFDKAIELGIEQSALVVVIWSAESVQSDWVRAEAGRALDLGKLLPIKIEEVRFPIRFTHVQCIDFIGWNGSTEAEGFRKLLAEIESRVVDRADPAVDRPLPLVSSRRKLTAVVLGLAVLFILIASAVWWLLSALRPSEGQRVSTDTTYTCADEPNLRSEQPQKPEDVVPVNMKILNETVDKLKLFWITSAAKREFQAILFPDRMVRTGTFAGHKFVITTERDACVAVYGPTADTTYTIKTDATGATSTPK